MNQDANARRAEETIEDFMYELRQHRMLVELLAELNQLLGEPEIADLSVESDLSPSATAMGEREAA